MGSSSLSMLSSLSSRVSLFLKQHCNGWELSNKENGSSTYQGSQNFSFPKTHEAYQKEAVPIRDLLIPVSVIFFWSLFGENKMILVIVTVEPKINQMTKMIW